MGHLRLGRLPKTRRWVQVVELLNDAPQDVSGIAASVALAADARLKKLAADPSLGYCFWLLTRIAQASRTSDFQKSLSEIGVAANNDDSVLGFISRLNERIHAETDHNINSGHFTDLSSLALKRTLSETIVEHSETLFGAPIDNLRAAFRAHSQSDQFGSISHKFFADFFSRTLKSLVDRELSKHVGPGMSFSTCVDSKNFMEALDIHSRESARIMQDFASDWYSKHNWESKGQISRNEAQAFVAVALNKLRSEFKLGVLET